jgi:mono/diheme cytochrome c family protein
MKYYILSIFLSSFLLAGCEYGRMYDQPNPRPTKIVEQKSPENIVQATVYHQARNMNNNPYPTTDESIEFGRKTYRSFCYHCHGGDKKGYTQVGDGFPVPPTDLNLLSVQSRPDSNIYRHIYYGGKYSPALGSTMSDEEIWKVIIYIRSGK